MSCEACGTTGLAEYIRICVTNGVLTLCHQCLDDVNRKNPRIPELEARIRELESILQAENPSFAAMFERLVQAEKERDAALKRAEAAEDELRVARAIGPDLEWENLIASERLANQRADQANAAAAAMRGVIEREIAFRSGDPAAGLGASIQNLRDSLASPPLPRLPRLE